MSILAIDPGTDQSGYVLFCDGRVVDSGVLPNPEMLAMLADLPLDSTTIAIEMIASYGMPVGREVFETCVWIGRFVQVSPKPDSVKLIYRRDVKLHLCGTTKAKDANVWQAVCDKLGAPGTKKEPGATYGVKSHARQALAVALTCAGV